MQRWQTTALCFVLLHFSLLGCALRPSPGTGATKPSPSEKATALLTAVDVDVFSDHTLITLQSDMPLRYAVRRADAPPRLIIDLPEHAVAPGLRPLEVHRGGVTVVRSHEDLQHRGSRVEIGLQPPVAHALSLPFDSTLLVEIRPAPPPQMPTATPEQYSPRNQRLGQPARNPTSPPQSTADRVTIGRPIPGGAEQATALIGVVVEPLADQTRVRVIGDGRILVYRTARLSDPSQLLLAFPSLTTELSGQDITAPTQQLRHLAIRAPNPEGTAIEMALASGVLPQITRSGSELVVELARPPNTNGDVGVDGGPRVTPVSHQSSANPLASVPLTMVQGTGAREQTPEIAPAYSGQRISLDFQQADLIDVLRLIAEVSGMNIITSPDVSGRVTTRMVNVPWDQALDMILKAHGLGKEQEGTIIRVTPLERLRKERDAELQSKRAVEVLEPPVTRTIQLSYARAEDLKENMEKLLTQQGRLDIDKRTNTVIVKDVSATVEEILNLIRKLDTQTKQVSIDTRIVETNRTFLRELGVRWGGLFDKETGVKFPRRVQVSGRRGGTPVGGNFVVDLPTSTQPASLGFGFSLISNSSILDLELQALERTGRGRIISNPKVVTLDNTQAIIESGDEVPFRTESAQTGPKVEFKDAKITLKVTPHVTPDDFVMLEIDAAKKEVDFSRLVEGNPTITSRQSKTSILVKDGATAVIGGLFKRTTTDSREGVPGLSKIPYAGWLFKSEQTREQNDDLLFFITPRIVRESTGVRPR